LFKVNILTLYFIFYCKCNLQPFQHLLVRQNRIVLATNDDCMTVTRMTTMMLVLSLPRSQHSPSIDDVVNNVNMTTA